MGTTMAAAPRAPLVHLPVGLATPKPWSACANWEPQPAFKGEGAARDHRRCTPGSTLRGAPIRSWGGPTSPWQRKPSTAEESHTETGARGPGTPRAFPGCSPHSMQVRSTQNVKSMGPTSSRTRSSRAGAEALHLGPSVRDHKGSLFERRIMEISRNRKQIVPPGAGAATLQLGAPSLWDQRATLSRRQHLHGCSAALSEPEGTESDNVTAGSDSDSGTAGSDSREAAGPAAVVTPERLWALAQAVRAKSPLVQSVTNFVVMNNSANALLAVGASPIMAHGMPEMDQMVSLCQALVVNIGTLDEYFVEAMFMGANQASALGKPWVLDPVGAGATAYRDEALQVLLEKRPAIIRGNASEILALARACAGASTSAGPTKGVDSTAASTDAIQAGRDLGKQFGCVVSISGETDVIIEGFKTLRFSNGDPMMTKVTGLGCSLSAVTGAFAAVTKDCFEAAAAAAAYYGVAGQLAAQGVPGPGSLQLALLDKLYNLTEEEFMAHLQMRQE